MPFPDAGVITSLPKLLPRGTRGSGGIDNIALYTLVPLDDHEAFCRAVLRDDAMPEDMQNSIKFPPEYDFSGKTMADLVAYHDSLRTSSAAEEMEVFDDSIFIVAMHEDYVKHGVLIVNLDEHYYDDLELVPAVARCPLQTDPPESAYNNVIPPFSWAINFQIANMGFDELQDTEAEIDWPTEIPGYAELQTALQASKEDLERRVRERYATFPDRPERYCVHAIGRGNQQAEPDAIHKEILGCYQKIATASGLRHRQNMTDAENWEAIRKQHPGRCAKVKGPLPTGVAWRVHKFWMFVFDSHEPRNEDVALVQARWDGTTDGKSVEELEAIMPELEIVERCHMSQAISRMDELSGFAATQGG